jgi:hypothetical protein
VEARRELGETGFVVTGTLGDGLYEGEVQVEVSSTVETVFLDEGLDPQAVAPFFRRFGREEVCTAMAATVGSQYFCIADFPSLDGKPRSEIVAYGRDGRAVSLRGKGYSEQLELPMGVFSRAAAYG